MTARLDQAGPVDGTRPSSRRAAGTSRRGEDDPGDDLDVPEFVPPG
jgi:hypothetical protein